MVECIHTHNPELELLVEVQDHLRWYRFVEECISKGFLEVMKPVLLEMCMSAERLGQLFIEQVFGKQKYFVVLSSISIAIILSVILPGTFHVDINHFTPFFNYGYLPIFVTIFFIAESFFGNCGIL